MKSTLVTSKQPVTRPVAGARNGHDASAAINLVEVTTGMYQEPLIVTLFGDAGRGKSRFIGTAPGTIGLIPMEHKSRQSVLKAAAEFSRKVITPEIDLIRTGRAMLIETMPHSCYTEADVTNPGLKDDEKTKRAEQEMQRRAKLIPLDGDTPTCCQRCYYRWHVNRVKSVAYRMAEMDEIRTIAIDTFGTLVDDMLFACYGRNERIMPLDRKTFNREVMEFINAISHKNLILTHHESEIWENNKPTGKKKPTSSFSKIGHFTSVEVRMIMNEQANARNVKRRNNPDNEEELETVYKLQVMDCQANAELIGMELLYDDAISFGNLAMQVYPDSDESNWE